MPENAGSDDQHVAVVGHVITSYADLAAFDVCPPEHHRLLDAVEPVVDGVQHVVVPHVPRPVRTRFGQHMSGALYVAGVDVPRRFLGHRLVAEMGIGMRVAVGVHVGQQLRHRPRGEVCPQRPRRVDVADAPRRVRHVLEHVLLVDEPVLRLDLGAVDAQQHAAERLQLQAGGGDDDVGVDAFTRTQHDAGWCRSGRCGRSPRPRDRRRRPCRDRCRESGTTAGPTGCTGA